MKGFKVDENQFEIFRAQAKEQRANQKLSPAYQRISYESYYLMSERFWHTDDYLEVIDSISKEELQAFIPQLLSNMDLEMLAHGNFLDDEARQFGEILKKNFRKQGADEHLRVTERTAEIPAGTRLYYQFSVEDVNSAIQLYYQVGPGNHQQRVTLELLQRVIEKPFYHQLRTIEQLGYLVWSGYQQYHNVDGFYFIIQSSVKDPVYLESRIEEFVTSFEKSLMDLSTEEFRQYREALISQKEEPPKNLGEETQRYWREITSEDYDFDRHKAEISALRELSAEDMIRLYRSVFMKDGEIKRLSVQAFGKHHEIREGKGREIEEPETFRDQAEYYENPEGSLAAY